MLLTKTDLYAYGLHDSLFKHFFTLTRHQTLTIQCISHSAETETEMPNFLDHERNTLEDVLFGEEEDNYVEDVDSKSFFIALRLSPKPEHLVKGYEFKMLNK